MKMHLFRLAFLLVCLTLPLTTTAQVVNIPDGNLALSIADALNLFFFLEEEIVLTVADMERLTVLNRWVTDPNRFGESISDLTGLEFATNLTHLYLNNLSISDISPLSGLTNLRILSLEGNSISNISLSGLTNLRELHLNNNFISDISLSGLTNLRKLYLNNNFISNISLSGLTNLEWLHLDYNSISNLSPLSGLTNLRNLFLVGNSISNLSPLSGLTNLTGLDLRKNSISDIYPLSGLTNLAWLFLDYNSISDIYPLSGLTNLEWLNFHNNSISDIYPLSGLTNLGGLGFDNNSISDLSPLVKNAELGKRNLPHLPDTVGVLRNPLSYLSLNTHRPALFDRGVRIYFDNQAHPALLKISGDNQTGAPENPLANPFVVEAQDANGAVIAGISVTFTVTRGDGTLRVTSTTTDANGRVTSTTTDANGRARSTLILGRYLGVNAVEVSADGIESKCLFHATISTPDPLLLVDVNGDGRVDILDLVSVASKFGSTGTNLAADVNGDGTVNILDLVSIAGTFGATVAAPSAHLQASETLTAVEVQGWLADARALEVRNPIMQRGIAILEQLLVSLTPKETALLANYPNPFNPETWIPYHLANNSNVSLSIYDINGALVRELDLGHQRAGYYTDRSRAAYWEGRNESGEAVASGVYFYQLRADDYSQMRKMVILK